MIFSCSPAACARRMPVCSACWMARRRCAAERHMCRRTAPPPTVSLPHFQHGDVAAAAALTPAFVFPASGFAGSVLEASNCSSANAARFGLSPSIAASMVDRSAAIDFFDFNPASRPIASVTSPAISWQVWMSCSAKPRILVEIKLQRAHNVAIVVDRHGDQRYEFPACGTVLDRTKLRYSHPRFESPARCARWLANRGLQRDLASSGQSRCARSGTITHHLLLREFRCPRRWRS